MHHFISQRVAGYTDGKTSDRIAIKQKRLYLALLGITILIVSAIVFSSGEKRDRQAIPQKSQFETASQDVKAENVRLTTLEMLGDVLSERTQALEKSVLVLKEEKTLLEREKDSLVEETEFFKERIKSLEEQQASAIIQSNSKKRQESQEGIASADESRFFTWEMPIKNEEKNVLFEIPAGTVVKAVLVSGADCTVAVHKPMGPNMILLRTLDQGEASQKSKSAPQKGASLSGMRLEISLAKEYTSALSA